MGKAGKPLKRARYATVKIEGHPLAHADGRLRIHRAVLYDKIGPGRHPCHWCPREVEWDGTPALVVDHINGDTWDNRPGNLVPSRSRCNTSRGMESHCRNGHARTPENTYIRPDKGTRMCRDCSRASKRIRVGGPPSAQPARVGLTIPASGLTLAELRDFVNQVRALPGDRHVYMAHELNIPTPKESDDGS